jgi:hypothetical protein
MILAVNNISETSRQGQLYLFIALKISKWFCNQKQQLIPSAL